MPILSAALLNCFETKCLDNEKCTLVIVKFYYRSATDLSHCGLDTTTSILVNTVLLPDSTKPLPEPVLINHQWDLVISTWGQLHKKKNQEICPWYEFYKRLSWYCSRLSPISSQGNWHVTWPRLQTYVQVSVSLLTHWGRVTHICVSKLNIIGSDNGLSPDQRQAIIWTNAEILLIRTLGTNFSEILGEIRALSFKKMELKMSSAKWRRFCLGLNVLSNFTYHLDHSHLFWIMNYQQ